MVQAVADKPAPAVNDNASKISRAESTVTHILDSIIRDIVQKDPASIARSFVDSIVNKTATVTTFCGDSKY